MSNYVLHYVSADGPEDDATWSVYREEYARFEDDEPIDGTQAHVETCADEAEANDRARHLQRLYRDSDRLALRPSVERVLYEDEDGTDLLIDGKHNVNFVPGPAPYERTVTHTARDGSPMRVEKHPHYPTWYVEVRR